MELPFKDIIHFILILVRISSFIMVAPFWSNNSISIRIKIGLCVLISFLSCHVVEPLSVLPENFIEILFLVFNQFLFGILLGFITHLFLYGIRTAAGVLDIIIGFGFGRILDPSLGAQSSILELFYGIFTLLILVVTNAHLLILRSVIDTFRIFPLTGEMDISPSFADYMIILSGEIFLIVLQIAGPVIAAIFLIDICLGIIAKTMPQMNVFIFGLPLKLGMGIMGVIVCLPAFPNTISLMVDRMLENALFVGKLFYH